MFQGAPSWAREHLALHPARALGPEPWQLITSGLLNTEGVALLFSGVTIWFFGTPVEQTLGRGRMLLIFIVSQLAGALVWALAGRLFAPGLEASGCDPGCLGLVAAFGFAYQGVPLSVFGVVGMKSRTMALLFTGIAGIQHAMHGDFIGLGGVLVGAGVGWALASRADRALALSWDRLRLWRLRRKYKVIPGGKTTPRYMN